MIDSPHIEHVRSLREPRTAEMTIDPTIRGLKGTADMSFLV